MVQSDGASNNSAPSVAEYFELNFSGGGAPSQSVCIAAVCYCYYPGDLISFAVQMTRFVRIFRRGYVLHVNFRLPSKRKLPGCLTWHLDLNEIVAYKTTEPLKPTVGIIKAALHAAIKYGGPKVSRQFQFAYGNFNLLTAVSISLTAISISLTAISICSRQFQFARGSFNLLTAVSICSRQFQFAHG